MNFFIIKVVKATQKESTDDNASIVLLEFLL